MGKGLFSFFGGFHHVLHQHRGGHGTHTAGNRGNCINNGFHFFVHSVAGNAALCLVPVNRDVNHDLAGAYIFLRQALQYASNKESIVEVLYEGYGVPCNSVFPTVGVAYNDELDSYAYDIEKAKALLAEAGYADGFSFEVTVSSDIRSRAAQILQQDYQSIGITININLMEFGAMLDYLSGKDHDAWIMSWSGATNPNYTLTQNFHTESGGATGNRGWYSNPEVDAMIVEARGEFDTEKRNQIYKDIQAKLMEESPWIPLLQQTYVAGMKKGVDGVEMYKTGSRYYHNAVVYED